MMKQKNLPFYGEGLKKHSNILSASPWKQMIIIVIIIDCLNHDPEI